MLLSGNETNVNEILGVSCFVFATLCVFAPLREIPLSRDSQSRQVAKPAKKKPQSRMLEKLCRGWQPDRAGVNLKSVIV